MRFEDLQLAIGKTFSLTVVGLDYKRHSCQACLVGYYPGASLIVMLPEKPPQVFLHRSLKVEAQLSLPQGQASFRSTILELGEQPHVYLHLKYPDEVSYKALRSEFRVMLEAPVEVYAHTDLGMTVNAINGHLVDLSCSGARLVLEKELTRMVKKISLGLFLRDMDSERDMNLFAAVRSVAKPSRNYPQCPFSYGFSFLDLAADDQLFIRCCVRQQALAARYQLCSD